MERTRGPNHSSPVSPLLSQIFREEKKTPLIFMTVEGTKGTQE